MCASQEGPPPPAPQHSSPHPRPKAPTTPHVPLWPSNLIFACMLPAQSPAAGSSCSTRHRPPRTPATQSTRGEKRQQWVPAHVCAHMQCTLVRTRTRTDDGGGEQAWAALAACVHSCANLAVCWQRLPSGALPARMCAVCTRACWQSQPGAAVAAVEPPGPTPSPTHSHPHPLSQAAWAAPRLLIVRSGNPSTSGWQAKGLALPLGGVACLPTCLPDACLLPFPGTGHPLTQALPVGGWVGAGGGGGCAPCTCCSSAGISRVQWLTLS